MDDLDYLRSNIDSIDKEIVRLFEERMETVIKVAEYKKKNSIPILNESREKEVIKKNLKHLSNNDFSEATEELLKSIMDISKNEQLKEIKSINKIIVGFQGVKGSFSHEALIDYFGENTKTKNLNDFEDVFRALKNNHIDYGVLPIENSSTGAITQIYDLLKKYGFYIVGETCVKVEHNLLATKGTKLEDIKEVYSHHQAFEQSSEFLNNYPNLKLIPYKNTAISAEYIMKEKSLKKAAIASKKAARIYNLEIIEENINFNSDNFTRFIVISKKLETNEECNKISIIFSLAHKPGTLFNILNHFNENNLNMLKIESRPIIGKPWEYYFYIDFEGCIELKEIKESISLIESDSLYFSLLGNYKSYNKNKI